MNRSSCLSVLLVGLSLTTTSAVFAAPSPSDRPAPKQVALNAQQGPDTGGSTAPADPTAAPTDPAAAPATPAVSVGTSAPVVDAPSQSAAEPAAKPKPRPFAGSSLYMQNSMSTNTIFRGQTQYANPTVETTAYILPRYAINDAFQLRGRLIVSYEYTNSDSTTTNHEPMLSDLTLQMFYRKLPALPLGIKPMVALNVGLPTSKASQARTMMFSPGATLQLVKPIEHFLGGEATIITSLTYSHPLYQSRSPVVSDARPYSLNCMGGTNCADSLSGAMNASDTLSYVAIFAPEWGHWSPALMYLGASQWVYSPKEVRNPVDGTMVGSAQRDGGTTLRQTHYLSAWLDYNFNSWFTGEIGVWNAVSGIADDGQRSSVIFDRYQDTRVYLGFSVQLDNLVKELQGGDKGDGGIVRAKNTKSPMFTF